MDSEPLTLLNLPEEVVVEIFKRLLSEDQQNVRLVSKPFSRMSFFTTLQPSSSEVLDRPVFSSSVETLDLTAIEAKAWSPECLRNLIKVTRLKLGRNTSLSASAAAMLASTMKGRLQCLELIENTISDDALAQLTPLSAQLQTLILRDCNSITLQGLNNSITSFINLKELDLGACSKITDATLEVIGASLSGLEKLDLTACDRFTATGLEYLCTNQSKLKTLLLPACWQIDNQCLSLISGLQNLECLGLFESGEHVTDDGLASLSTLTNLTALDLGYSCWSHTSKGLCKLLPNLKSLKMLNIGGAQGVDDGVLAELTSLEQLTMLDCSECQKVTPEGIKHLKQLVNLQELNLGLNINLKDSALENLTGMTCLTKLDLSFCGALTDLALKYIVQGLPQLKHLVLRKCSRITDTGLGHLAVAHALTTLDLSYCNTAITSKGMKHVAALSSLEHLILVACHAAVTVPGMSALAESSTLTILDVADTKRLDDGCMQALSWIKPLRRLVLRGCVRISDHGIASLCRSKHLRVVVFDGCPRLTQAGVDALCTKLPLLKRVKVPTSHSFHGNTIYYGHQFWGAPVARLY